MLASSGLLMSWMSSAGFSGCWLASVGDTGVAMCRGRCQASGASADVRGQWQVSGPRQRPQRLRPTIIACNHSFCLFCSG